MPLSITISPNEASQMLYSFITVDVTKKKEVDRLFHK